MGTLSVEEIIKRRDEAAQTADKLRAISTAIEHEPELVVQMNQIVQGHPGVFKAIDVPATEWINRAIIRLNDYIDVMNGQIATIAVEWPPRGKKVT